MQEKVEDSGKKAGAVLTVITLQVVIAWLVFVGSVLLFFWMATVVFIEQEKELDQAAFAFAGDITDPETTDAMYFITFFGSKNFLIFGSLGLALLFLVFRKWRFYSLKIIAISATTTLFNQSMKLFFARPRPDTAFMQVNGNSFPSGHAMIGGAFWGLIVYLVWTNVRQVWLRWVLSILLGIWILLIGFSRVYLNVHYASDVLAGWAAGIFWLIIAIFLLNKLQQRLGRKVEKQIEG
ncbi:phosphatase PAP2 family protein [Rufibacter latericius]|uniref:Phosphatase PAP2 family protein n=1 Tax=Rufibacter latericius TaxID=2487040 RepID=A0A3M9MK60_9BACT|nr:phosphatase PAP2 family protein [Rufibacter latericius]RNI25876.1 phosphatase PAP2 family protein [Rufibacter latericius]